MEMSCTHFRSVIDQVVSLRPGDLTQEEYNKLREEGNLDDQLDVGSEEVQGPKEEDEG